jgi:hypothetical protein
MYINETDTQVVLALFSSQKNLRRKVVAKPCVNVCRHYGNKHESKVAITLEGKSYEIIHDCSTVAELLCDMSFKFAEPV